MAETVARRSLMQAGALAGGLAAIGFGARPAAAEADAPAAEGAPFDGMIAAHIRLDCRHGATVRLTQLDRAQQPVRQVGAATLSLAALGANPLHRASEQARLLARDAAAKHWGVPAARCVPGVGSISEPGTRRRIGYRAWVDVV